MNIGNRKRDTNKKDDCEDFTLGKPNGKRMSDGHYMYKECKCYRKYFLDGGQNYIDAFFSPSFMYITTLKI